MAINKIPDSLVEQGFKFCSCRFCRSELLVGEEQFRPGTMFADHLCLQMIDVIYRYLKANFLEPNILEPPNVRTPA